MSGDDGQETFKTLTAGLNNLIRESVREDLAWQGRDVDPGRFTLEDVTESLEVAVASPHHGVPQLECRDVRLRVDCQHGIKRLNLSGSDRYLRDYLVVGVHLSTKP